MGFRLLKWLTNFFANSTKSGNAVKPPYKSTDNKPEVKPKTIVTDKPRQLSSPVIAVPNFVRRLSDKQVSSVLNYWLEFEYSDVPECPFDQKKGVYSAPADQFKVQFTDNKQLSKKVTSDSQLFVMLQCHRAGYLFNTKDSDSSSPQHPNTVTPRTYVLGLTFDAVVRESSDEPPKEADVFWVLSEDKAKLLVNSCFLKSLFRYCNQNANQTLSITEWIEQCQTTIQDLINLHLSSDGSPIEFTSERLQAAIIELNRGVARKFWPTALSREFMGNTARAVESVYQDEEDMSSNPSSINSKYEDIVTFRWRYCFYSSGHENTQLGSFFDKDLANLSQQVNEQGASEGLSPPLFTYLSGNTAQIELKPLMEDPSLYYQLTRRTKLARWPENPKFGLSLLQACAVNLTLERKNFDTRQHPVVSVNGPPGTGKTTLLKDVAASMYVSRTLQLLIDSKIEESGNLTSDRTIENILDHSIVVASSNNKAVENISMELPSLDKVHSKYQPHIGYFKELADDGEWGLFCGILGNSANRKEFCDNRLKKLTTYLGELKNYLKLSPFVFEIKRQSKEESLHVIVQYFGDLKEQGSIDAFINGVNDSSKFLLKYADFFRNFCSALGALRDGKITVDCFASRWCAFSDKHWVESVEALLKLSQVWYRSGKARAELKSDFDIAKQKFLDLHRSVCDGTKSATGEAADKEWGFCPSKHLISIDSFTKRIGSESTSDCEARIQQYSPQGSEEFNNAQSELFVAALAVNEALIKLHSFELLESLKSLPMLVNGNLKTQEVNPEHKTLWGLLFLLFPVLSTSLSSVASQFKLMKSKGTIGLVMLDESGQAVNYHVAGLLQRSRQAIVVGDPIQLEPVVTMEDELDRTVASDFIDVSLKDGVTCWGDPYLVTCSSAQTLADSAGWIKSKIGERTVGLPLFVHRRCVEPMFSIANKIAYDDRMIIASAPYEWEAIPSGWVHIGESEGDDVSSRYQNKSESKAAFDIIEHLVNNNPDMVRGGIYIISPFKDMKLQIQKDWATLSRGGKHEWVKKVNENSGGNFGSDNIGTVHTFQGKEASVVILCLSASKVRGTGGGINWVNSKPNLLNVAVTRAKHHLFVVGDYNDWGMAEFSSSMASNSMLLYKDLDAFRASKPSSPLDVAKSSKQNKQPSFDNAWSESESSSR